MRNFYLLLFYCASFATFGQGLSIDTQFAHFGVSLNVIEGAQNAYINSLALQPDMKIIACGQIETGPIRRIMVNRYLPDGNLDTSFGTGGTVFLLHDIIPSDKAFVRTLDDGKIIVVFTSTPVLYEQDDLVVARLTSSGSLDNTFGDHGFAVVDHGGYATGMELLPGNKILIVGELFDFDAETGAFGITRLNADGTRDASFGNGGAAVVSFKDLWGPQTLTLDNPSALQVLNDGKIVIGGTTFVTHSSINMRFALARLNADGSPDNTFGSGGRVITDLNCMADLIDIVADSEDQVYAMGYGNGLQSVASASILVKYDASGQLVNSFGQNGVLIGTVSNKIYSAGLMTSDGHLLVLMSNDPFGNHTESFMQYNPDGSPDTSFGENGVDNIELPEGTPTTYFVTMLKGGDDKLLLGGMGGTDFTLARFRGLPRLPDNKPVATAYEISPNPATSVLDVQMPDKEAVSQLTISDISGKVVMMSEQSTGHLDISAFKSGLYILKITGKATSASKKFVKN